MNRRSFLRITGVVGSSVALGYPKLLGARSGLSAGADNEEQPSSGSMGIPLADTGWRMWPDMQAEWQHDRIYLPGEMELAKLPANPPTGGWNVLRGDRGREVTLPATVEQFYWGATGFRPYHDEYKFEPLLSD